MRPAHVIARRCWWLASVALLVCFAVLAFAACTDANIPPLSGETDLVTVSETEPVSVLLTESIVEPATDPTTRVVTEPETVSETHLETAPMSDPITESETEVVTVSITDLLTEPTTDAVTESITEPATEPVTESETERDGVITLAPPSVPEPDKTPAAMPRLDITTEGGQAVQSKEVYVNATVSLSGCHEEYAFSDAVAGIRVRGNSTASPEKKPYRLKFAVKQSMLGLNNGRAYKSWCLMADYYDGSMLRTFGTFKFAKALLENRYFSSDCTHVEVYINGEYRGVYLLCEQTQINSGRVDIPELADGDTALEQGYLLIGQGGRNDEPGTVVVYPGITVTDHNGSMATYTGMNFALSGGDYTEAQKKYVSDYVSGVFKVVAHAVYDNQYYSLTREGELVPKTDFAPDMTAREKEIATVGAVFNIEAAVSMCILDEIVKNLDAMTFNMYVDLSPEGDGVLTLAAPWDFDFSMANTHYATTHSPNGYYATNLSESEGVRTNLWYVMLGSIDWFEDMIRAEWKANYLELQTVVSDMISTNYRYDSAFKRDWARWGAPNTRQLIHHHDRDDLASFADHEDAGNFVTDWLTRRLEWLNRCWGDGGTMSDGDLQLTFTTQADMMLIEGIKRCEVTLDDGCLALRPTAEAYDPYFTFRYDVLGWAYDAQDHAYLEFTYRIPADSSAKTFATELFLCTGQVYNATGGISTTVTVTADGEWHTARVNLGATGYWEGIIHAIRFDFFSACEAGDVMYLKDFKLLED